MIFLTSTHMHAYSEIHLRTFYSLNLRVYSVPLLCICTYKLIYSTCNFNTSTFDEQSYLWYCYCCCRIMYNFVNSIFKNILIVWFHYFPDIRFLLRRTIKNNRTYSNIDCIRYAIYACQHWKAE